MTRALTGRLYDTPVVSVRPTRSGVAMSFHPDALDRWGAGSQVLSLGLPLAATDPKPSRASAYVEGLLPEGDARALLALRAGISGLDTFGMIRAYGRDVAGAITFLDVDDQPETGGDYRELTQVEIGSMIRDVSSAPLGNAEPEDSKSLAGYQHKILLARRPSSRTWFKGLHGAPSTHILKPPNPRFPDLVFEEHFAMKLASRSGLDAEITGVEEVGGVAVLVVQRYDRDMTTWPPRRVHQEDMVQALGVMPERKYQRHGGSVTLKRIARLLRADELPKLLGYVTFMSAVGDADQHGKNLSVLHDPDGGFALAPLYDLAPTYHYSGYDNRLALSVGKAEHVNSVCLDDLVREGTAWGLGPAVAQETVAETLGRVAESLEQLDDEDARGVPESVVDGVRRRVSSLRAGRVAGSPDGGGSLVVGV